MIITETNDKNWLLGAATFIRASRYIGVFCVCVLFHDNYRTISTGEARPRPHVGPQAMSNQYLEGQANQEGEGQRELLSSITEQQEREE
jgi:hypothetical protein